MQPLMQSNRQQQKHPITIPEISTKRPQTQLPEMNHTRLPHSEGDEALRTATVSSVYNCNSVLELRLTTPRPRPPRVGRQHTPYFFEKDNTHPVQMHHANEFTAGRVIRPMFHRHLTHLWNTPKAEPISATNKNMPPALCRTTFAQNSATPCRLLLLLLLHNHLLRNHLLGSAFDKASSRPLKHRFNGQLHAPS